MRIVDDVVTLVRRYATEQLQLQGLHDWAVKVDAAKVRAGCCNHKAKTISLSRPIILANPIAEAYETVLHEIAHAITDPAEEAHGDVWKANAIKLGAKPIACGHYATPEGKYLLVCLACGKDVHKYHRRPRRDLSRSWCIACGPAAKGLLELREV